MGKAQHIKTWFPRLAYLTNVCHLADTLRVVGTSTCTDTGHLTNSHLNIVGECDLSRRQSSSVFQPKPKSRPDKHLDSCTLPYLAMSPICCLPACQTQLVQLSDCLRQCVRKARISMPRVQVHCCWRHVSDTPGVGNSLDACP